MNNLELVNECDLHSEQIEDNFLSYCRSGNYKQVVHMFDKYFDNPGFDINCRDNDGNTALILAARQGHGSIIQEILRYVPDISLENKKGHTVMHLSTVAVQKIIFGSVSSCIKCTDRLFCNACWLGNAELVERAICKDYLKMSASLTNLDGISCFQLTIKNIDILESISNKIKWSYKPALVLQSLLSHWLHAAVNYRLLHMVATKCCKSAVEVARVLLKKKNFEILDRDEYNFTPIHHAARNGNNGILELLLPKGLSKQNRALIVDCQGRAGNTPLHLAASEGREDCVRILLRYGAATDVVNSCNYTPLQCSKSVRIKNIFLLHMNGATAISKEKLLPDLPYVLNRSSTGMSHLPHSRILQSGKKSAEPAFRGKSLSNPEFGDEFHHSSRLDAIIDSSRLPMVSGRAVHRSSELSSTSELASKLKSSRSVTLECLDEEIRHEISHPLNPVDKIVAIEKEFAEVFEPEAQENHDLVDQNISKSGNHNGTELLLAKRRAANISAKQASRIKPSQKIVKTIVKKPDPARSKANHATNNPRKKASKKPPEEKQNENSDRRQGFVDTEAVGYESDFHTDSSQNEEKNEELKDFLRSESDSDEEEDEDSLNRTWTNQGSARMSDRIEWKRGEQLGKGSYGTVWKGMLENGQYIAVKEILVTEEDDLSESSLKNSHEIKREIEILQTIRHRNIVKYIGAWDSQTCIHIFMEFVSGGSIAFILSKFGAFSENIIRIYSRQIATGIAFLHDKAIVHRDVKGANIMVTPRGVIKLVDFGCAKRLETFSSNSRSLTQQSRLQGSVYWLAPEVINGAIHNPKSDIWSIGCTVVEMMTTKPPWSELHPYAAMFAIGTGKRPALNLHEVSTSNGGPFSGQIIDFVNSCLVRHVANRPSALELLISAFLK